MCVRACLRVCVCVCVWMDGCTYLSIWLSACLYLSNLVWSDTSSHIMATGQCTFSARHRSWLARHCVGIGPRALVQRSKPLGERSKQCHIFGRYVALLFKARYVVHSTQDIVHIVLVTVSVVSNIWDIRVKEKAYGIYIEHMMPACDIYRPMKRQHFSKKRRRSLFEQ